MTSPWSTWSPSRKRTSRIRPLVLLAIAESSPSMRPLSTTTLSGMSGARSTRQPMTAAMSTPSPTPMRIRRVRRIRAASTSPFSCPGAVAGVIVVGEVASVVRSPVCSPVTSGSLSSSSAARQCPCGEARRMRPTPPSRTRQNRTYPAPRTGWVHLRGAPGMPHWAPESAAAARAALRHGCSTRPSAGGASHPPPRAL